MGSPVHSRPRAILALLLPLSICIAAENAAPGEENKETAKVEQAPSVEPVSRPRGGRPWAVTLQTGFADTFQLTLGGVFGAGPAWQSRVTLTRANVLREGDAVSVSGFNTHDTPAHNNDWTAAVSYRIRLISRPGHVLYASGGLERWRFPGVLCGAQDWNLAYNATYATSVKRVPVTVQSSAWTILHSNLPGGSLVHTLAWFDHKLAHNERFKLVLRHGPQHTYSWNFYGTNGHRVVRYASALVYSQGPNSVEFGYRQQYGLQKRIPDNRFWHLMLTRTF